MKIVVLAATLATCAMTSEAQQPKKVPRIGYLSAYDATTESPRAEAIRQALRERGHIEGQNFTTEYRYAEGKNNQFSQLAANLVKLNVDIIVVIGGDRLIRAVKNATKTISIVMVSAGSDPVEARLVDSLAHPGGNVTGVTSLSPTLGGKRLELFKEAVPTLVHVAVLYDPAIPSNVMELKEFLPVAARALRLTLQPWEVRTADDFDKLFAAVGKQRTEGLYVPTGPLMFANGKRIAALALKSRLPSIFFNAESVDAGGLMSYSADESDSHRRVAYYVDRILNGAKPADLPVEQPTKFDFVINLKTAKQIGLTIPPDVLARANKLIR